VPSLAMVEPRRRKDIKKHEGKNENYSLRSQWMNHKGTKAQRCTRGSRLCDALTMFNTENERLGDKRVKEGKGNCALRLQWLSHKGTKAQRCTKERKRIVRCTYNVRQNRLAILITGSDVNTLM
jgi:hypothetical protein